MLRNDFRDPIGCLFSQAARSLELVTRSYRLLNGLDKARGVFLIATSEIKTTSDLRPGVLPRLISRNRLVRGGLPAGNNRLLDPHMQPSPTFQGMPPTSTSVAAAFRWSGRSTPTIRPAVRSLHITMSLVRAHSTNDSNYTMSSGATSNHHHHHNISPSPSSSNNRYTTTSLSIFPYLPRPHGTKSRWEI